MKSLMTLGVLVGAILAGSFGGSMLKGMTASPTKTGELPDAAQESHGATGPAGSDHGGQEDKGKPKERSKDSHAKDGHGKDKSKGEGAAGEIAYHKFTREFVVPLLDRGHVSSLVILNLSLEVDASISGELFSKDPKIRDRIMSTLITLSHDGRTFDNLNDPEVYETLRTMLARDLQEVIPEGLHAVLILDIAKQDI